MMRLLIRTASNAYYPQKLSVLSIPEAGDAIRLIVKKHWGMLQAIDSAEKLAQLRALVPLLAEALAGVDATIVLRYVEAEREGQAPKRRPIKLEEFEALTQATDTLGDDTPEGDFFARRLPLPVPHAGAMARIDRVVIVHRLREVSAQLGFTRFESIVPDILGELDLRVRRADIATEPTWLPAVETRGEGVFLAFRKKALEEWRQRPAVRDRAAAFSSGLRKIHPEGTPPDITYVMLHSLAHMLITAVALDCGYNTSSIRERVYVTPAGCGILLFTGTSDAEGTLGGLAQAARRIDRYLDAALEMGRLCSNDPVCAQHAPDAPLEERYTLGAACHGCLLIAETCCEQRNELLDRSLVVSTVEGLGCEFFPDED